MDWCSAQDGLEVAFEALQSVSAASEPCLVALHYRNVGAQPLILRANETSADDEKLPRALRECPLYPLDAVELASAAAKPNFEPWTPVPSQMFQLDKWVQLLPGAELKQVARLDTKFWEVGPRRGLTLGPGVYMARARMKNRALDPEHAAIVRGFLSTEQRNDAMAFWDLNLPLSLGEAFQLEKWGWKFWRGEVLTSPIVIERT